ncbi:hypothetical protein [Streptomyces sp. NPDC018833]|uniref:hypothetical protein n=1 Tax=Streptomyces sp. NPDC018833 TaxID=3365053 RepID=UPI0037A58200
MSEQTPSQAEGERQEVAAIDQELEKAGRRDVPRTTPSQAEGDRAGEEAEEGDAESESGWSGP